MSAAISPDGKQPCRRQLLGCNLAVADTRTGKEVARPTSHSAAVIGVAFDAAGTEIRTAAADGSAATWDVRTGDRRTWMNPPAVERPKETGRMVPSPDGRWVMSYQVNPNGPIPAVAGDLVGHDHRRAEVHLGHRRTGSGVGPSPGREVAGCRIDSTGGHYIQAWDTKTGQVMPAVNLAFHPTQTKVQHSRTAKRSSCAATTRRSGST